MGNKKRPNRNKSNQPKTANAKIEEFEDVKTPQEIVFDVKNKNQENNSDKPEDLPEKDNNESTNMKCETFKDCRHYKDNNYQSKFLYTLIGFSVLVLILAFIMGYNNYKSQQKIVDIQEQHYQKINAVFSNMHDKLKEKPHLYDSILNKIIKDSSFIAMGNDSYQNQLKSNQQIKSIIIGLANNVNYKDLTDELKKDSLLINNQTNLISQETKSLLELEFNKLQNEYEVLAVWGAVLTIVFLIFSFYSLFKTDDLAKQGRDGLKDIVKLQDQGDNIINKTKEKHDKQLKEFEGEILGFRSILKDLNDSKDTKNQEYEGRFAIIEAKAKQLDNMINFSKKQLDIMYQTIEMYKNKGGEENG